MAKTRRQSRKTLSIIIVHYKSGPRFFDCISSIYNNKPHCSFEIIVVDNNKTKTLKSKLLNRFSEVKYIKSAGNIGYGAGNNLGIKNSIGEYLLILNPDTKLFKNTIDKLLAFIKKDTKIAIVAPNLIDQTGKVFPQLGSTTLTPLKGIFALSFLNKLFPKNKFSRDYYLSDISMDEVRKVDVVPGSAFLMRKDAFNKVGRYDENMFLYFEESDLGKRLRNKGYKLFIIPQAEVLHYWKEGRAENKNLKRIFGQSRFYYFHKHYGLWNALLVEIFANFSKWHALILIITFL